MGSKIRWGLACLALAADVVLAIWLSFRTTVGVRPLLVPLVLGVLWVYVELAQGPSDGRRSRIIDWHRTVFACVGVFVAVKMGLRLALELDAVSAAGAAVARRGLGATAGFLLAIWGNYLPRLLSPWSREEQPFDWQGVHRFVGWIATISGAGVTIVWLALPEASARPASIAMVITFAVLALGRKLVSIATYRPPRPLPR
jgi:hypothetical protein